MDALRSLRGAPTSRCGCLAGCVHFMQSDSLISINFNHSPAGMNEIWWNSMRAVNFASVRYLHFFQFVYTSFIQFSYLHFIITVFIGSNPLSPSISLYCYNTVLSRSIQFNQTSLNLMSEWRLNGWTAGARREPRLPPCIVSFTLHSISINAWNWIARWIEINGTTSFSRLQFNLN